MTAAQSRVLLVLALGLRVALGGAEASDEPPEGVEQILPRGRLEAIFQPTYVEAKDARIPADAWILGVVIDGEARAYDLNLLNRHEVVNDRIGDIGFAAVW